jgi:ABC-type methionine transport system permease subunit
MPGTAAITVPTGSLTTNRAPATRVPDHRSVQALRHLVAVVLAVSFVVGVVVLLWVGHVLLGSASGTASVPSPRPGIAPHAIP